MKGIDSHQNFTGSYKKCSESMDELQDMHRVSKGKTINKFW